MDLSLNHVTNISGSIAIFLSALKYKVYEMIYNICFEWKWINKFTSVSFNDVVKMLSLSYKIYLEYNDNIIHIYDYILPIITINIDKDIMYKFIIETIPQRRDNICYVLNIDADDITEQMLEKNTTHGCLICDKEDVLVVSHKPFGPDLIELGSMLTMDCEKKYVPSRVSKYIDHPNLYYHDVLKNKIIDKVELNPTNINHMKFINKYMSFLPGRKYFIDEDMLYRCSQIMMIVQNCCHYY